MTKKELKEHIATNNQLKDQEIHNKTKTIRRMGKDENDIFYALGKVHGIENIVYLSDDEVKEVKTPVHLQQAINDINQKPHRCLTKD
jgi:hypothetical protein